MASRNYLGPNKIKTLQLCLFKWLAINRGYQSVVISACQIHCTINLIVIHAQWLKKDKWYNIHVMLEFMLSRKYPGTAFNMQWWIQQYMSRFLVPNIYWWSMMHYIQLSTVYANWLRIVGTNRIILLKWMCYGTINQPLKIRGPPFIGRQQYTVTALLTITLCPISQHFFRSCLVRNLNQRFQYLAEA